MKGHLFVLCALALISSAEVPAGESSSPDSEVYVTVFSGDWKHDGMTGTFRVVVRNFGVERVTSQVSVDWVTGTFLDHDPLNIVRTQQLLAPGIVRVTSVPNVDSSEGKTQISIRGTSAISNRTVSCVYDLTASGSVVVVRACT